jgi:hypothetical protein
VQREKTAQEHANLFRPSTYKEMLAVSPDLESFAQGKTFIAQLCVYSGQMDFTICELKNEQIEWISNVE